MKCRAKIPLDISLSRRGSSKCRGRDRPPVGREGMPRRSLRRLSVSPSARAAWSTDGPATAADQRLRFASFQKPADATIEAVRCMGRQGLPSPCLRIVRPVSLPEPSAPVLTYPAGAGQWLRGSIIGRATSRRTFRACARARAMRFPALCCRTWATVRSSEV